MPKPTIVDLSTLFNANIIQPLCDLTWDVFGSDSEDRPVNTVDEAREKLKAVAKAGDTMTGPLTLPATDPTLSNHATRKAYVDDQIDERYDSKIAATLEAIYPVGSIYFCATATSPNGVLPGTWVQIAEGRFLVAAGGTGAYTLGATGGAESVTLTTNQMPAHTHDAQGALFIVNGYPNTTEFNLPNTPGHAYPELNATGTTGGGAAHENRPPYYAVNLWQRTA